MFQTDRSKGEIPKILFTGDFPNRFWEIIETELYEKYEVVKVPHHGTKDYYWDKLKTHFSGSSTVLITNGDGGNHGWFIDYRYPEHLNLKKLNYKIYCFDKAACPVALGNGHACVCKDGSGCFSELKRDNYIEITVP